MCWEKRKWVQPQCISTETVRRSASVHLSVRILTLRHPYPPCRRGCLPHIGRSSLRRFYHWLQHDGLRHRGNGAFARPSSGSRSDGAIIVYTDEARQSSILSGIAIQQGRCMSFASAGFPIFGLYRQMHMLDLIIR